MSENRFLEVDRELHRLRTHHHPRQRRRNGQTAGLAGAESFAAPFSATDRVLVVLIENGGIDLGLPDLVDRLLALVPGASILPDSVKTGLVTALRDRLRTITDNLLETAELTLNRFGAAKPDTYADVVVLRDGSATYADLKRTLIAQVAANKIVDVVILTHGANDWISVADGIDGAKIRAIRTEAGRPIPIRSVYMMNCVGSSLNQAWLDAGAKTSAGALRNNYLPEPTTHFFWANWRAGQPFETAVTGAYRQTIGVMNDVVRGFLDASPIPGTSALARLVDFANFDFVADSAPVVQGQRTLTISSDDLTFDGDASRASSLATTVLPLSVVKSLSDAAAAPQRTLSDAGLAFVRGFEQIAPADQRLVDAQRVVTDTVSVPLSQNQIDALVDFVLGVGGDSFRSSTLLRELNASHYQAVPDELRKWTKVQQNGNVAESADLARRRSAEADLFARADAPAPAAATAPAVSASMGAVNYTVPGLVAPLQQPSPMTCWATVIAMMTSWKRQQSISPRDAIAPAGAEFLQKFDAGQPLDSGSAGRLYQALGLVAMQSLNPSIDGWDQFLRLYGPLYVDIGYPQVSTTHAVIVTGISGDGTPDGTTITYVDPAIGSVVNRKFGDFLANYETQAAVDWPYVITHWPATQAATQSLAVQSTYKYESAVPQLAREQFAILGIAVADAIQIGLGTVAVVQTGVSASAGTFNLTYDKAQRLLTPEARRAMPGSQAATQSYRRRLFDVGISGPNMASAQVNIEWQGNAYGEIATPQIQRDLDNSTDWTHSDFRCAITKPERIPPANVDPRAWPIVYTYEGAYDPVGNGNFEFQGEFEIDAFGGIRWSRHHVVSRSLLDVAIAGSPEDYVVRGPDVASRVADIPPEQLEYLRQHPTQ
jgi:GH24 family phage-related lysozyme (muramidase)